jgi:hypothetical protein
MYKGIKIRAINMISTKFGKVTAGKNLKIVITGYIHTQD